MSFVGYLMACEPDQSEIITNAISIAIYTFLTFWLYLQGEQKFVDVWETHWMETRLEQKVQRSKSVLLGDTCI